MSDQEVRQIARSSLLVSAAVFVSRCLGLARDMALVYFFAATTWMLDAFYFAFMLPNLLRNLLGEGALTAAFIPQFMRADTDEARGKLAGVVLGWLLVIVGGFSLMAMLTCFTASFFAARNEKIHLTLILLVITFPFAVFICASAILGAILQCRKIFVIPAAMSCFLNLFIIAAVLTAAFTDGVFSAHLPPEKLFAVIHWTALAIPLAGVTQILIQYPLIIRRGVAMRISLNFDEPLKKVLDNFIPAALGLGVVQFNSLLDNLIGYGLALGYFGFHAEGATSYLFLANRLMQLPLGVFTLAVATTAFPTFAKMAADNQLLELRQTLVQSLRNLWFVMLPAAAGLIVIAQPLTQLLYQSPDLRFSDAAVYRVSAALVCLAPALPLFSAIHLFTRAFYALNDYRTPVKIAVQTVIINLIGNLSLMWLPDFYRQHYGIEIAGLSPHLGEAGLTLSTTICAGINAWRLWLALDKKIPAEKKSNNDFVKSTLGMIVSAAGMAVGTYFILRSVPYGPELFYRLERVLCAVGGAAAVYMIFASTFCLEDYERFLARIKRKK